jgi:hypothetical protein
VAPAVSEGPYLIREEALSVKPSGKNESCHGQERNFNRGRKSPLEEAIREEEIIGKERSRLPLIRRESLFYI